MSEATPAIGRARRSSHQQAPSSVGTEAGPVPTAVYVRVSTAGQTGGDRYGLDVQESACRRYADANGLRVTQVYTDVISGTKETRTGLEALLREAPRYRAVVVYAIDRLARNVPLAYKLLEELQDAGLDVHSACEGVQSLGDESGALRFGIMAVIADHERRRITRRMYAGKLEKARQGKLVKPIEAYGYRDNEPFEDEAKWVRFIFEQVQQVGFVSIAKALTKMGVPTPDGNSKWASTSIDAIIKNATYKGEWYFGRRGERVLVPCPAIVTSEEWERAQQAATARTFKRGRRGSRSQEFQLQGRIYCAHCGFAMSGRRDPRYGGKYRYYICLHSAKGCEHKRNHRIELVHEAVSRALRDLLLDEEALKAAIKLPPKPMLDVQPEVERLKLQLARAKDAYLAGAFDVSEYKSTRADIEAKMKALEAEVANPGEGVVDLGAARERVTLALALDNLHEVVAVAKVSITLSRDGAIDLQLSA